MSWSQILGHEERVASFRQIVARRRLAHAYLFVGPAGVCLVKGGPNKEMALALIDMLLSADLQDTLQPETFAFPSNSAAKPPLGLAADVKVHNLDWEFVAKERGEWVKRWDRDMAM